MAEGSSKPWWESEMDWSLQDTVVGAGQRLLRSIPEALAAYKLGKTAREEIIEELPVEKIGASAAKSSAQQPAKPVVENAGRPLPKIIVPPAPPKPGAKPMQAVAKPVAPVAQAPTSAADAPAPVRAVNMDQLGAKPVAHTPAKPAAAPGSSPILSALRSAPKAIVEPSTGIKPAAESKSPASKVELSSNPLPSHVKDLGETTLTRIREKVEQSGVTLEQLLDPDFQDYR